MLNDDICISLRSKCCTTIVKTHCHNLAFLFKVIKDPISILKCISSSGSSSDAPEVLTGCFRVHLFGLSLQKSDIFITICSTFEWKLSALGEKKQKTQTLQVSKLGARWSDRSCDKQVMFLGVATRGRSCLSSSFST